MSNCFQFTAGSFQELNRALESYKKDMDFLLQPGGVLSVRAADCREMPLVLSNTDYTDKKRTAVLLDGMENITLDFNGSMLECEGQLQPLTLLDSRNITVKNLVIDWEIPLSAEGTILQMTESRMDVRINPALFPFEVRENRLYFLGNGEPALLWTGAHTVFHPDTRAVCMKTGDELRLEDCAALSGDTVRFTGRFPAVYPAGSVVVLRHSERVHAGIFAENCENVLFENITVHATGGLGILCQFNRNLTFRKVSFRANAQKGRQIVNGHDDGLHLTSNAGTITVENCYFHGLMDDPINVHGLCARIEEVTDRRTVIGRYVHHQSRGFRLYARQGDLFSVIRSTSMHSIGRAHAASFRLLSKETFRLQFAEELPEDVRAGDALENLTNTASFLCRDNYFGPCRARGILVSTPRTVRVEDNLFQTAGSAVLIAGDANYWYESGACRDVAIRRNSFAAECLSTPYGGCEAVVSICPEVPEPDAAYPFHRNILLEDNTFFSPGVPVVYAFCTENLKLRRNRIFRCRGYSAAGERALVELDACSQVSLEENRVIGDFPNPFFSAKRTPPEEIDRSRQE